MIVIIPGYGVSDAWQELYIPMEVKGISAVLFRQTFIGLSNFSFFSGLPVWFYELLLPKLTSLSMFPNLLYTILESQELIR